MNREIEDQIRLTPKALGLIGGKKRLVEEAITQLKVELRAAMDGVDRSSCEAFRTIQDQISALEGQKGILEQMLGQRILIIEPNDDMTVDLGSSVKVQFAPEDELPEELTLTVVSADDIKTGGVPSNWVSTESPIGKALLGGMSGDRVICRGPSGNINLLIKEVLPAEDLG